MKSLNNFSTKQLKGAAKTLDHAKSHRKGGLLITEQSALDNIKAELELRR